MRVYRFTTDEGERVIGRVVMPEALPEIYRALGVAGGTDLSAAEAWDALIERGATLELAAGLRLRRAFVMHAPRVELTGFGETAVPLFKALGLVSEIVSWKLRLFVPLGTGEQEVFAKLIERYPLIGVEERVTYARS